MPTGLSGLYRNTRGAKISRRHGEFPNTNPYMKSLAQIRKEAYEDGYGDGYEDGYRAGQADKNLFMEDDGR